jgi:hypothetical protein
MREGAIVKKKSTLSMRFMSLKFSSGKPLYFDMTNNLMQK